MRIIVEKDDSHVAKIKKVPRCTGGLVNILTGADYFLL